MLRTNPQRTFVQPTSICIQSATNHIQKVAEQTAEGAKGTEAHISTPQKYGTLCEISAKA